MNNLEKYYALKKPLSPINPKLWYYKIMQVLLEGVGNLSDGIKIGNTYGYDSGVMLDYVYKNEPSGKFGIGKIIDKIYLNSIGWRGIRNRKVLIEDMLKSVVSDELKEKEKLRYLDMACGGGEYDIQTIKEAGADKFDALLRDYKEENIQKAKTNAKNAGLEDIRFQRADAFDKENYKDTWDIVVSSGFWEIIEDDNLVKSCLINASKSLEIGGSFIFTIQPNHPQLEFIGRVLRSNTGEMWTMRLRSLDLYKKWMEEANLKYVSHTLEEYGIFGVVHAKKV